MLGTVLATWPLAATAQQSQKIPTIGFLGSATEQAQRRWTAAFVQRLRELGWIEGQTIRIEYRWAAGSPARAADAAGEFVRSKVDIILTNGTSLVTAIRRVTSEIPIVFAAAGDPVGTGLVASLSRPGGNVTGFSVQATDLAGKHLELLRQMRPGARRLAMLFNVGAANARLQMQQMQAAAGRLGFDFTGVEIRKPEDIAPAIDSLAGRADVLFVANEPLTVTYRARINALAIAAHLPTMYAFREFVDSGGLMSYGPSFPDLFRRSADYVDKILRGAKPGDLPVQQPVKFELVINLKTAKALGIEIPPTLLALADEVIE
jgi:putative ABC transport system substrate-binding protein